MRSQVEKLITENKALEEEQARVKSVIDDHDEQKLKLQEQNDKLLAETENMKTRLGRINSAPGEKQVA